MAGCQSGLFEYEFVYIEWTATSLGAVVGGFGGLFLGVVLLGVAVFVHQLKLARMQSETSLKDQFISLCAVRREQGSSSSEVFSHSIGGCTKDWPIFNIPCNWDDIASSDVTKTASTDSGVAFIVDNAASAHGHFVMPAFPASLADLLASVTHSTSAADLSALQSTDVLDANIHLLAVLCEGFFLLKDAQVRSGAQSSGSVRESVQQVEEAAVELRKAVKKRENLLGATTHEGLDKRMEALLQWEREWLTLAFDMIGALYRGVCLLDDAVEKEECGDVPGLKKLWSQFQIESVQQMELRLNQWHHVWHSAKEEAVNTVLAEQSSVQQVIRRAISHVLDQVRKNVNEADLPETAKEKILRDATSYLEQLQVESAKTGLSLSEVPGAQWSGDMDTQRKELRKVSKQVDVATDKTLSAYLMRDSAEWKRKREDRLCELGTFLEEVLSNQQAWHSGLLEELSELSWLLVAKEHSHLTGLKETVREACGGQLAEYRAQLDKIWANSRNEVEGVIAAAGKLKSTFQTTTASDGSTPQLTSAIFTDGVKELTTAESLPGLNDVTHSSVTVLTKMVEGMQPELRLRSAHLLTQHSANVKFLHFQLMCSLERLTKCAKWLLVHLWAAGKQKHHRKVSTKEEEEAHAKQLQAVLESFQSLLEKEGTDFVKTQEEELEKEFEEMRQEAEKETHLEEKQQQALTAVKDHLMNHAAETSGMMHLVSERILLEHQTAVRKIQDDMERTRQHQLMILQQKLQARKLQHERMIAQTAEELKAISPDSAVAQALLQLLVDVRQRRAEKEFKRELEEEHKRELAFLEAKLNQQMKHKLKSQEMHMIQSVARTCKLSNEQLAAEISSATAGMGNVSEQIIREMAEAEMA